MKLNEARRVVEAYYRAERGLTLDDVISRWQDGGDKLYDSEMPVVIPVPEVWPHREYTWSRREARISPEEWNTVKASLKAGGWRADEPLHFQIGRQGGTKVGEGNHRLAMARELGIRSVPVFFHYYSGRVTKDAQRAKKAEAPPAPKPRKPTPTGPTDPETEKRVNRILGLLGGF